jgi:hypothetical protein
MQERQKTSAQRSAAPIGAVAWRSKFDLVVLQVSQQLPYCQKVLLSHAAYPTCYPLLLLMVCLQSQYALT